MAKKLTHRQVYALADVRLRARTTFGVTRVTVTTAQLRRALHDPRTPREAKVRLYPMLLTRRRREAVR